MCTRPYFLWQCWWALGFTVSFFQAHWQKHADGRMHCYSAVKVQLLLHDLHGATVASSPVFPCAHTHLPQTFKLDAVWWVRGPFLFRALKYIDLGTLDACRLHHQLPAHRQSWGAGRRQHVGFVPFNRVSSYNIPRRFYHAVQTFKLLGLPTNSIQIYWVFSILRRQICWISGSFVPIHLNFGHLPAKPQEQVNKWRFSQKQSFLTLWTLHNASKNSIFQL